MRRLLAWKLGVLLILLLAARAMATTTKICESRNPASLRGAEGLVTPSKILYKGETQLSADLIANFEEIQATQKQVDPQDYIPLNMQPTDDASRVISVIADKSVSKFMNDPQVRASSLGRTATKVEKTMTQEVVLGSNAPNEIEHKLNFQVLAFQARAEMKYEGITNALVSYQAGTSTTTFEVFENLPTSLKQQLVLSHELRPTEKVSNLSVRWSW